MASTLLPCLISLCLLAVSMGSQCLLCTYREAAMQARNAAQKARQASCAAAAYCYEQYARSYDCEAAKYGPNLPSNCPAPSCDTSCSSAGAAAGERHPISA